MVGNTVTGLLSGSTLILSAVDDVGDYAIGGSNTLDAGVFELFLPTLYNDVLAQNPGQDTIDALCGDDGINGNGRDNLILAGAGYDAISGDPVKTP